MVNIDIVLDRLSKVRGNGKDRWMACCPAHDDKSPSLAIAQQTDGRILFNCFAGCGGAEVVSAMNLDWSDFYNEERKTHASVFGRTQKASNEPTYDDYIIAISKSKRSKGERLTQSEKNTELQAIMRSRK